VTTKDGGKYQLGPRWEADSFQNISGSGYKIEDDSSKHFKGTIRSANIEQLPLVDNLTPAVLLIVTLSAVWMIVKSQK
jgi:hypothetical protein